MKFLNNMSKNTSDVIGAIIAVTIFWFSIQFFIDPDVTPENKETTTSIEKKVN